MIDERNNGAINQTLLTETVKGRKKILILENTKTDIQELHIQNKKAATFRQSIFIWYEREKKRAQRTVAGLWLKYHVAHDAGLQCGQVMEAAK